MDFVSDHPLMVEKASVDSLARKKFPTKLFLEVTTRCNLKCEMCVKQSDVGSSMTGDFTPETFSAIESALPRLDTLILNGVGEPLLHPHLEQYVKKARKLLPEGASVGFQTNGVLLDYERAESLLDAGVDRICLSMDAVSSERFRAIRAGGEVSDIELAFSALNGAKARHGRPDIRVGIEFVLMRRNLSELPMALRWAARQGAAFAIVTQLLPYDKGAVAQAAYDTNTAGAIDIYSKWKTRSEKDDIDLRRYAEIFLKYAKSNDDVRMLDMVERMKDDASGRGIALHIDKLLARDEEWLGKAGDILAEAQQIADAHGMTLTLPGLAPANNRRCEFVEAGSIFVSWDGYVHPCYFLWHRYRCYVGGWEKLVKPRVFGNLLEEDILEIWNKRDYCSFRESVIRYDFPFCFDCNFALCDYVQGEDFEQDCYVSSVPCGACLWCTSLFHCLQ